MDDPTRQAIAASQAGMLGKPLFLVRHRLCVPLAELASALHEHHDYVARLGERLVAAGPLLDAEGEPTGDSLWIVDSEDAEQAMELAAADPLCVAGLRAPTVEPWRLNVGRMARSGLFDSPGGGA